MTLRPAAGRLPLTLRLGARSRIRSKSVYGTTASGGVTPALRAAVVARDQHTCWGCGFTSLRHQDLVVISGEPRDIDNIVTACPFCSQCVEIERVAQMRSGVLIWLPELDQAAVHHVARDVYRARLSQDNEASSRARRALDRLIAPLRTADGPQTRRAAAVNRLGFDDPAVLAEALGDEERTGAPVDLHGIRLWPLDRRIMREGFVEFNQFPMILAYWRSEDGPFAGTPGFPWLTKLESALQAA